MFIQKFSPSKKSPASAGLVLFFFVVLLFFPHILVVSGAAGARIFKATFSFVDTPITAHIILPYLLANRSYGVFFVLDFLYQRLG